HLYSRRPLQLLPQLRLRHHHLHLAVLQQIAHPLARQAPLDRQVWSAPRRARGSPRSAGMLLPLAAPLAPPLPAPTLCSSPPPPARSLLHLASSAAPPVPPTTATAARMSAASSRTRPPPAPAPPPPARTPARAAAARSTALLSH